MNNKLSIFVGTVAALSAVLFLHAMQPTKYERDRVEIREMVNSVFDEQHPECKNYKTNSNLPELCY